MSNEEMFEDLKQYMDVRLSRTEERLEKKIDETNIKIDKVKDELVAGSNTTTETIIAHIDEQGEKIDKQKKQVVVDHEARIAQLERAA